MSRKRWTKEEEDFLKENYLNMTHEEVAEQLGRSIPSISLKISKMRLIKCPQESHDLTEHALYSVWYYMKLNSRRLNFEIPDYWKQFSKFYDWAISNGWEEGLRFCRKNENLPFSRENCEFISQSEVVKKNIPKIQNTNLERYGVKNPAQNKEIKEKIKKTNFERYGVDCPLQNQEVKKKTERKNLEKYGRKNSNQNKEIKEKIKRTNLDRYGVECSLQNEEIKKKSKQTSIKKWGVEHPMKSEEIKQKIYNNNIKSGNIKIFRQKTMKEWAEEFGVCYTAFQQRVKKYGFEKAIKMERCSTSIEVTIADLLDIYNIKYKTEKTVDNFRADFLIEPDLIIETDGLFWHSDAILKDKYYHFNKQQTYLDNGYTSLFFREDEINEKLKIVESIILNKLNRSKRIFARKCVIREISRKESKKFLEENHLMGNGQGRSFVLVYGNEVVSLMRVKKKKDILEISRFCHKLNYTVVGGFSKLLSFVVKTLTPKFISTFIDKRYGCGKYLLDLGFNKVNSDLSFRWVYRDKTFHRMKFPRNSGYENGCYKIWDCGQTKYIKKN